MASRAVREVQALKIVNKDLEDYGEVNQSLNANVETLQDLEDIPNSHPWVLERVSHTVTIALCWGVREGYVSSLTHQPVPFQ